MKRAHITSRPHHEVGDKVLGLCGKEFKVKVLWDDIGDDKPICRTCVDVALKAMTEADVLIERARRRSAVLGIHLERLTEELEPDLLLLDSIAQADEEHHIERDRKAEEKAERKRSKQTCTCWWSKTKIETVDPNCPIHGDLAEPRQIEDVELPEGDQAE